MAAVGELRNDYGDRVELRIISAEETAKRGDELRAFFLEERKHGLVAFTKSGTPAVILAGHSYGIDEVRMAIEQVVD